MGKHGRARVIRAELERRAALLKNGDVRFRFIDSTRQWAVYLPHIGKEMGVFSRFDAAAEYALRHRQPGQQIEWPWPTPSANLRSRSQASVAK